MSFYNTMGLHPACIFKMPFPESEEGNVKEVFVTRDGELIELNKEAQVLNRLCLPCPQPLQQADPSININIFYIYQPFFLFYLILIGRKLFIIKKINNNELKICKSITNVSEFFIKDPNNLGEPKILVLYESSNEPAVIDVHSPKEEACNIKKFTNALLKVKSQIQGLNSLLSSSKRLLLDKKIFVSKLGGSYLLPDTQLSSPKNEIPLLRMFGKPSGQDLCNRTCPVSCGSLWSRQYFDSWVVGVHIINNDTSCLNNLELMAAFGGSCLESSSLWTGDPAGSCDFTSSTYLPPQSQGFVLGLIRPSFLVLPKSSIPFILSFSREGSHEMLQCYLGVAELSLSSSSLSDPLKSDSYDILAFMLKSRKMEVLLTILHEDSELTRFFQDLNLVRLNDLCYTVSSDVEVPYFLRGLLIKVNNVSNDRVLRIYYRNKQQLVWFLDSLKKKLLWSRVKKQITSCADAFAEEISSLQNYIRTGEVKVGSFFSKSPKTFLLKEHASELVFHGFV